MQHFFFNSYILLPPAWNFFLIGAKSALWRGELFFSFTYFFFLWRKRHQRNFPFAPIKEEAVAPLFLAGLRAVHYSYSIECVKEFCFFM